MLIKDLTFDTFSELFTDKEVLIDRAAFNKSCMVDVSLNLKYNWRLIRTSVGGVALWYCEDGESVWHFLGELDVCDFSAIEVG